MLDDRKIDEFIREHILPGEFKELVVDRYLPLASWIVTRKNAERPLLLGINGAQGTGKSTLADFLQLALQHGVGWNVANLSIDDFYLTRHARTTLGRIVHPLLETRGVPGTHDLPLLWRTLRELEKLDSKSRLALPRFDKAQDDRAGEDTWPVVSGPIDLIILEGWCVGSVAQQPESLTEPINALEKDRDSAGRWRAFVNRQLADEYAGLFDALDVLVFLKAPDFESVYRWRLQQEQKLAARVTESDTRIMNEAQISQFIQHYERITRSNLVSMASSADVVLELDVDHSCVQMRYRDREGTVRSLQTIDGSSASKSKR